MSLDHDRIIFSNTQPGTLIRFIMILMCIVMLVLSIQVTSFLFVPLGILAVCLALFHSLTTEVTESSIRIRMGIGVIRRTIPVSRVRSTAQTRTPWYIGWGIRLIPRRGWLWNVSGFDSVELEYRDGGHFRIGTDMPRELAEAIDDAISLQKHDDPA